MNSHTQVSDQLRAQIEAQTTPEAAALILANLHQSVGSNPEHNADLLRAVSQPDYEDRGMWGPLGGKGGTVSRIWLAEQKRLAGESISLKPQS